jgi:hypothetical protein
MHVEYSVCVCMCVCMVCVSVYGLGISVCVYVYQHVCVHADTAVSQVIGNTLLSLPQASFPAHCVAAVTPLGRAGPTLLTPSHHPILDTVKTHCQLAVKVAVCVCLSLSPTHGIQLATT